MSNISGIKGKNDLAAHQATLDAEGGRLGKLVGNLNVRGAMIASLVVVFLGLGCFVMKDDASRMEFFRTAGLAVTSAAIGYLAADGGRGRGSRSGE